jgi:hypothetical protein
MDHIPWNGVLYWIFNRKIRGGGVGNWHETKNKRHILKKKSVPCEYLLTI